MNWSDKLNQTELEHVIMATNKRGTLQAFRQSRQRQAIMAIEVTSINPNNPCKEICPECKAIAVKLGIESWK